MSKLYELIQKLCPNGVEYKSTTELSSDTFWLMPSTPHYIEKGIPYITSKNVKNGKISFEDVSYISEKDYIEMSRNRSIQSGDLLITMIGTIGETAFVEDFTEFYGQNLYLVRLNDKIINPKFYYYYFETQKEKLVSKKNPSSQGYIKAGSVNDLKIPVPPMEVQSEIVHILDQFTLLTAELTAELTARKQQYEYYLHKLIKTKSSNEIVKLKEVCTSFIVPMRDRPKVFDGNIPWCRIEDKEGHFFNKSLSNLAVSDKVIKEMNLKVYPVGTVICSCSATLGAYAINTQPLITNQTFIGIVCGPKIINKYLLYFMETYTDKLRQLATTGTIPYISRQKFEDIEINLPSLDEQQRIVDILDKFDAYCNDLTQGLPAEIELRKQQYEYYRDKLLSFKELK